MPVHAFIFPGQGSQTVGMGRDLSEAFAAAREVFQEVDDTLGETLSRLMFEGPPEQLTLTENAQPALMAHSLAVLRVLEREGGFAIVDKVVLVAGHSLGEYSALAAAGSFTLAQTARLLRLRGQAMQRAVPPGEGAMAALLGCELELARQICDAAAADPDTGKRQVIDPANDNGGGQMVISGHTAAVTRAIELAKGHGVRRAMLLPVSAGKVTDPAEIARLLVAQVTGTVRWRESVLAMASLGVDSFIELGAGKVLSGLLRRILPDAAAVSVGTPADIELLLKTF
jgi:[acyl-carrier-protein] S-malonyltransferase